ncbi:DUF5110 domain-containing protein, partial [Streptomyces sp. WAC05292]|uniref:TIM-barrel domain-containing protein n=1 Tax=Streptomyces sp. WAC05292 TaxID=2487418 RepID=UPI000F74B8EC
MTVISVRTTPRRRRRSLRAALLAGLLAVAGLAGAGPVAGRAAAAAPEPATAGNATGITRSGNTFTVTSTSGAKARVVVARADIFRLWLSPDGRFADDPAGSDLARTTDFGPVQAAVTDAGGHCRITTPALNIRVDKSPLKFSVYRADNRTLVWEESRPTSWTATRTTQYLSRGAADMPSGWFLPNDGYGCGYTEPLKATVDALAAKGFRTGLWTSTGLTRIAEEVAAGSRAVKTDVAWIGGGYKNAFAGVQQAVDGIEKNSDARRFVWTVDGWAGTQRNAVVWTGDTHGTWDDMRWHVPAIAGAGLSALNHAAGDVDGIFGGSPQTYVRDLQWKSFTPVFMTMSGWGATHPEPGYRDKQPWRFEEPYRSINRRYLQLKMRLMPYHYTMSRTAHETGVPATRAMVLEYPDDPVARGNLTSGQFMAGDSFLVAPVVSETAVRDGIHLPAGTWTDYWTGKTYAGPGRLDGHRAPLDTLPLFVKGGAIVPMWPQMNHTGEKPVSTLTYDIHPRGSSSFSLYEDDGLTRAHQSGAYARQRVDVSAPASGAGTVTVSVGAPTGSYSGKPASRGYELTLHVPSAPARVDLDGAPLTRRASKAAFDAAATGWFHDPADRGGILWVKAGSQAGAFTVTASGTSVPDAEPVPAASAPIPQADWRLLSADSQETAAENGAAANGFDGNPATMWHTAWSGSAPAALPHEISVDLGARHTVDGLGCLPRQDGGANGRIGRYELYVSDDPAHWGPPAA